MGSILPRRIAILGLGRSGLGVAKAALRHGSRVAVFDRATAETLSKPELLDEARALGVEVVLGWNPPGAWEREATGPFFDPEAFDVLVTNPAVDSRFAVLRYAGIPVWSEVEFASRLSRAPIAAVTGTNGKSTTTVMTMLALRAAGIDAVLCGNIFGSGYPEQTLTEAALESTPDQVLVAEVSSFQLEWVPTFAPQAAAITAISPDHLDRYDRFEDYAQTKRDLFKNQREGQVAIVGPDVVAPEVEGRAWKYGIPGSKAWVEGSKLHLAGQSFDFSGRGSLVPHNRVNSCAALLLALGCVPDLDLAAAAKELSDFKGIRHRMEWIGERRGIEVFNNSMCTNPAAVVSSAATFSGRGRHLIVGGANKGLDFSPVARLLLDSQVHLYPFGRDGEKIAESIGFSGPCYRTMEEAARSALAKAEPGEVVMLSPGCASMDAYKDFRHRGEVFTELAKDWLTHG